MQRQKKFSVLMSVYYKEKAEFLNECLNSLIKQTCLAAQWVIVKDGPLNSELEKIISNFDEKNPGLIKIVALEHNVGLGLALREGVKHCDYDIIARMDTDDIARADRFETQLKEFEKQTNLSICGSYIKEFEGDPSNVVSTRKVPLSNENIYLYQRRRSAFNHMTVMFKKNDVLEAGNYEDCPLMEDDMLWIRMMKKGYKMINIPEYLVFARVGNDMIKRRGGFKYFAKYRRARKRIYATGLISLWDYFYTLFIQFAVSLLPCNIRRLVFYNILRK